MKKFAKTLGMALALVGLLFASGCQKSDSPAASGGSSGAQAQSGVFRVLAGSELKDVAEEVVKFGQSQGVKVVLEYSGSLDAVDRLIESHAFDAVWLSHGKYPQLVEGVRSQIKASEKTMYSKVVLGIKPEKAKELGWNQSKGQVSWKDVIAAVKAGKLKLAMTNPAGSNTGFVTLVGVAAELSGKGDALEPGDIPSEKLKELFSGVALTSGSSGDLAERFKADPSKADAIVNYDASIKAMTQQGLPLQVLVPKEGVITADYPLMLLARSQQQAFYDKLVAHLREPQTQEKLTKASGRTPLTGDGSDAVVNELPFPGSLKVVDALLDGYLHQFAKASTSHFVLDISGSMGNGGRIEALKQAMNALAVSDGTVSGRFATFRDRENIVVTPFSNVVFNSISNELGADRAANKKTLVAMDAQVQALQVQGGTAIYDALAKVYPVALQELKQGKRNVSIVLMTDGENRDGRSLADFQALVQSQGEQKVPVFAILYGEANQGEMNTLAALTGGRVFDARKTSLKSVMKTIRNYQ